MVLRRKAAHHAPVGDNRRGNAGEVASEAVDETIKSDQKLTPAERSFQITEEEFEKKFKTPRATLFSHFRDLRNNIVADQDMQEKHQDSVEKINNLDGDIWDIHRCSPLFARRLRIQSQKFKKASVKTCIKDESPSKTKKSAARVDAGKMKAGSLTFWQQACQDACAALKAEGYSGSVSLKKGGPMYTKALELLKNHAASASSASAGPAV